MIINTSDMYTCVQTYPLTIGKTPPVGTLYVTYEVRRYRDVRNLGNKLAYQVLCTQRIMIPNSTPYAAGPQDIAAFSNYPALITAAVTVTADGLELVSYSPRTINASISTSLSSGTGKTSSTSRQHTSGSSLSQTNSFGASASLGFFGKMATGGLSWDEMHSTTNTTSTSDSRGTDEGRDKQSSMAESMSVKDWACYAYLDVQSCNPTWVWGQEYPWNVIQFNNAQAPSPTSSSPIKLPSFVSNLLVDAENNVPLPPSQLSLFGVDFIMKSAWIVDHGSTGTIAIAHNVGYCTASHSANITDSTISTPQTFPFQSPSLDLCVYGLDPLMGDGSIIGFAPRNFVVAPSPASGTAAATPFKILSADNTLLMQDATAYQAKAVGGFNVGQTGLTASFGANCSSLIMQLTFKVADGTTNYTLYMKHWKTGQSSLSLEFVFNGDTSNIVRKSVSAAEGEGGENNLLSFSIRNQNFGSIDYHDFLQLGLNTVQITFWPDDSTDPSPGYQLRAISVEAN